MAADVVNLRKARKARDRVEKEARAAENRARFGRTKAEKRAEEARTSLDAARLDGHRLSRPDGGDGDGA